MDSDSGDYSSDSEESQQEQESYDEGQYGEDYSDDEDDEEQEFYDPNEVYDQVLASDDDEDEEVLKMREEKLRQKIEETKLVIPGYEKTPPPWSGIILFPFSIFFSASPLICAED